MRLQRPHFLPLKRKMTRPDLDLGAFKIRNHFLISSFSPPKNVEGGKDVTGLSERGRWLSSPDSYLNGAADRPISYLIKQAQGVRGVCVMFLSGAWSHLWQDRFLASTQEEAETSQRMSHDFRPTDVLRDGDLQWNTDGQSIVFEIPIPHMYYIYLHTFIPLR